MISIISPAKSQDFSASDVALFSHPQQFEQSLQLVKILKKYTQDELAQLMSLSDKLAKLNYDRFEVFADKLNIDNAKQALLAFRGDVYKSMDIANYNADDFTFAQGNVRILSGLYGVLRPLDLIQPYRLEMSTKLKNHKGDNLYNFWESSISNMLNQDKTDCIINLASGEYFKAIDKKNLNANIITINFKENKNGVFKTIGILAKRARGAMINYIIKERVDEPHQLKQFKDNNYCFNADLSDAQQWVFTR